MITRTIAELMNGMSPKIEPLKRKHIIERYGTNKGAHEKNTSQFFYMLWQPFAWAAILGFFHNKRKSLNEEARPIFKYSQIINNGSDIFYALIFMAVAKEGYSILEDPAKLNQIIEEHANGGFEVVFTILNEKGEDYFSSEKNFLQELLDREKITIGEEESQSIEKEEKPGDNKKIKSGDEFDLDF